MDGITYMIAIVYTIRIILEYTHRKLLDNASYYSIIIYEYYI